MLEEGAGQVAEGSYKRLNHTDSLRRKKRKSGEESRLLLKKPSEDRYVGTTRLLVTWLGPSLWNPEGRLPAICGFRSEREARKQGLCR